jgi:hypothetical protein
MTLKGYVLLLWAAYLCNRHVSKRWVFIVNTNKNIAAYVSPSKHGRLQAMNCQGFLSMSKESCKHLLILNCEGTPRRRSNCQTEKLKSGYGPNWGPSTKTNWPTDRRSQYNLKLNLCHCTANYRPVLSSERAPYMKNKESNCHSNKCNIWSLAQKGARHQDELAD